MENTLKKHKIFGRPCVAEEDRRSVKVAVFLTAAEAGEIRGRGAATNLGAAEFLRRAGLGKKIEAKKSMFDADALRELRALGRNVNQISRALSRAKKNDLGVNYEILEARLNEQIELLHCLKIRVIEGD